ncbi:hypothetical protein [Phytohabitans kaempferiae]|uniref:Uncharacterized protein n=1 Tax=Phytohabitans kaempferiae TaxID=1620943 RepID=A0ABV6M413_9ACTN
MVQRRRWRVVRRIVLFGLVGLTAFAVVSGLVSVRAVRRSFPRYGGEVALPGLAAEVTVYRDA